MKRVLLSTIAIVSIATAGGDFVDMTNTTSNYVTADNSSAEISVLKAQMNAMQSKLTELENKKVEAPAVKEPEHKGTLVKSHVPVLKFSGTHYLGFVNSTVADEDAKNKFETRRNYLQVKAYFKENPKDYMRITLDTHDSDGESNVRLKYAYLYLDNVLPNTGVEFGQAHRPWIDYEEHSAWNYRSISKVMVEDHNGAHLTNSADRGINFKTKTPYFSSELGVFNGEGYHGEETGDGLSGEWRLTGHVLGTGKKKSKPSETYANISFFGQQNQEYKGGEDLNWMGLHAVYNQPEFLVAAQYIDVPDGTVDQEGTGYSVNGEYRITPKINALGRYDYFDMDDNSGEKKRALAGIAYKYNHNVEFIANYLKEGGSKLTSNDEDNEAIMLTAAVEW
jgi:hypothetical protein